MATLLSLFAQLESERQTIKFELEGLIGPNVEPLLIDLIHQVCVCVCVCVVSWCVVMCVYCWVCLLLGAKHAMKNSNVLTPPLAPPPPGCIQGQHPGTPLLTLGRDLGKGLGP